MKPYTILKPYAVYNVGEVAGFDDDTAKGLLALGVIGPKDAKIDDPNVSDRVRVEMNPVHAVWRGVAGAPAGDVSTVEETVRGATEIDVRKEAVAEAVLSGKAPESVVADPAADARPVQGGADAKPAKRTRK